MARTVRPIQEYINIMQNAIKGHAGQVSDFSEGSMLDILTGAMGVGFNEVAELMVAEFRKTYIDTAVGEDLQNQAVDKFGPRFSRPQGTKATVDLRFSRPNRDAGQVIVPRGTVVKTVPDADGVEISFVTRAEAMLTNTHLDIAAEAVLVGTSGNVVANTLTVLELPLTDPSVVVTNPSPASGGTNVESDAQYRDTIRNLITALSGATKRAIEGALRALPQISFVSLVEEELPVIPYDIAGRRIVPGAEFFRLPNPVAYIADAQGNASQELVNLAINSVSALKACGIRIVVRRAVAETINFTGRYTLNAQGPNFATLQANSQLVRDSMRDYINRELQVGQGFSVRNAQAHILEIWGPGGTNDLTQFTVLIPSGDVAPITGRKLIAGEISIVSG